MAQQSLPSHLPLATPPQLPPAPAAKVLVISEQRTAGSELIGYTWTNQPGLPVPISQSPSYSLASILAADPSLLKFMTALLRDHWVGW